MSNRSLEYVLEIGGLSLPAREVTGREAMSAPFRFEVHTRSREAHKVDPQAVIKTEAALLLVQEDVRRRIDAVVTEVFVMESVTGQPSVRVVLEPRFALSRHRTNLKIYRDKDALAIVAEVLGELGVAFELRTAGDYPVRPYTVQFRESDFHFVSRMLEEEGCFYYFAEGDVMVIGDAPSAYSALGAVPYRHGAGLNRDLESVWGLGPFAEATAGQVALRDWCIDKPSLPMDVSAGVSASGPEWYDYPGEYADPGAGQRTANLIAESFSAQAAGAAGVTTVAAFAPGRAFVLDDAPSDATLATGASLVVSAITHDFDVTREGFALAFEARDGDAAFRPARVHDEPILPNPITGVVTGPAGADIHCDELGRVKVHFHWDRHLPLDDTCSHWVPVMQDNTGHSVAIPRVGWEVLVHFLEGDPDRPVVLGRVYNAEDVFPVLLPANKTITQLGSLTTPSREGMNLIELEDRAEKQQINIFAQKDQNVVVANDRSERVQLNEMTKVSHDETIEIGNDHIMRGGASQRLSVGGSQTVTVGANQTRSTGANYVQSFTGSYTLTIGGNHKRRVSSMDLASATTTLSEQVGAAVLEASVKSNGVSGGIATAITVGGAIVELTPNTKSETAGQGRAETIGGVVFTKAKKDIKINAGKSRVTTVGGALKIDAKKTMSVSGGEKLTMEALAMSHSAKEELCFRVGESFVVLGEDVVRLYAPDTIRFEVENDNLLGASLSVQNSGQDIGEEDAAE